MQDEFYVNDWHVIPATGQLIRNNEEHRLEPRAMAVLVYLYQHANEIVTRNDLETAIWPDTVVTYEALTVIINKIRNALGDNPRQPLYIETLAKRGYRLIATTRQSSNKKNKADTASGKLSLPEKNKQRLFTLLLFAIVSLAGVLIFTALNSGKDQPLPIPQDIPSIAVIPFSNISGDKNEDYFAYGITEYLITDLSRLSSIIVTSRNSVLGFKSNDIDIPSVSRLLRVRYVITGSVLKQNEQMRIAVQLTDSNSGRQIWADRYDKSTQDLFSVQDEIIDKVISALVKQVNISPQARPYTHTANHEAHEYYIRGNALYTSISKEANTLAREMFQKAIELDPGFATAYGAIALTYVDDYRRKWGDNPDAAVDRAFEFSNRAIAIDKNAAVAHVVQAYAFLYGRKQPHKAINSAKQAIKLHPNYADAYAIIGSAYSFIDRSVDAIRINHHAMRLNPTSSYIYFSNLGRDHYFLKQYKKAIDNLENAIFRNENYLNAHIYLAATYASLNQLDDANWEVDKILILDPDFSLDYWASTQPYQSSHRLQRMVTDLHKAGLPD